MAEPPTPSAPRTAREVIDAAIRENRSWEWVSFGLTVAFAVVGLVVLAVGAYQGNGLVALAGTVAGAVHSYDGIRRFRLPMNDAPAAAPSVPRKRSQYKAPSPK